MLRRRVWEPNRAKCIDGSGLVEVWSTHCRVFFHQTKSFHLVALKTLVSTRLIVTCCCSSDSLKPASSVLPFQVYEDLGRRRRWKRLYIYIFPQMREVSSSMYIDDSHHISIHGKSISHANADMTVR